MGRRCRQHTDAVVQQEEDIRLLGHEACHSGKSGTKVGDTLAQLRIGDLFGRVCHDGTCEQMYAWLTLVDQRVRGASASGLTMAYYPVQSIV